MEYMDFLRGKMVLAPESGIDISETEIHPSLKPHQKDAVRWAIKGGRRALFEAFGLGKTVQELEWCRILTDREGGKALIVLPLGVKQEFVHDAQRILDMETPQYVRTAEEVEKAKNRILMTNYERVRDGDIDPKVFTACCLDEASVLRSFGSKTYQSFLDKFRGVKYKLVATATPDPNRYKELIHYAGFLEVMDTGQALTRFFQRDSTKANNLTLYPHKEKEFWLWCSTWALFLSKPSDLGYEDDGYALPQLDIRYHKISSQNDGIFDQDGQMKLQREVSSGLTDAAREKRESLGARITRMKELVDEAPEDHFILWHDLEDERRCIKKVLPHAIEVYGSLDLEERERRVIDFSEGTTQLLATKKEISGSGCNFQKHCHRAIFVGIDYKFNDFIQAIHRIYRFLQTEEVRIDIIYTENESEILQELIAKWERHNYQVETMSRIVREYGLSNQKVKTEMGRSIGVIREEVKGSYFTAIHNDCVDETSKMPANSVGLIHTSIPFSNHYEYTPSYNDFGHNEDTERFFTQMDFLTPNLLKILMPGRVLAVHVKDRVLFGNATGTGMPTIEPFHALCIEHYMKHGFQYFGMITIITDVVRENNQTYRLGWTEQCKDGSKMGVGCPEYLLLFRKLPTDTSRAYADTPVTKSKESYTLAKWQLDAHGFWRSSGNRLPNVEELSVLEQGSIQKRFKSFCDSIVYDYDAHVKLSEGLQEHGALSKTFMTIPPSSAGHPDVWDDVNRMRTLNLEQKRKKQESHVCPLQIDIVERIINRFSNPGDTVFDPFAGLFTVPVQAVKMGRYGIGTELNPDYFKYGIEYLKSAEAGRDMPTLFDFVLSPTE